MEDTKNLNVFFDIEKRSLNGAFIYTAAWLIIAWGTGFINTEAKAFYLCFMFFIGIGILRLAIYNSNERLKIKFQKCWVASIYINSLLPAALFGVLFALSMVKPSYNPMFIYLLMVLLAMLSGGIANFAPKPSLSLWYILVLVIPALIGSVFFSSSHYLEAAMLLAYGFYMMLLSKQLNQEYQQRIQQQLELERLNNEDSLTGIKNRRAFDAFFKQAWTLSHRNNYPLSLMILDIDLFKSINDTHGHAAGDEVIRRTASIIQSFIARDSDCVARIGGEEFAAVLSGSDEATAYKLAEKIRNAIEQDIVQWMDSQIRFTISIGVGSCIPHHQIDSNKLFTWADQALYQAKESGRNQSQIAKAKH